MFGFVCSIVFWIGDLNYRLSGIDVAECKALIAKKEYQKLMNYDQVSNRKISCYLPDEGFAIDFKILVYYTLFTKSR